MDQVIEKYNLSKDNPHMSERVISPKGICFTVMAMTHGYGMGYIMEYEENSGSNQDPK